MKIENKIDKRAYHLKKKYNVHVFLRFKQLTEHNQGEIGSASFEQNLQEILSWIIFRQVTSVFVSGQFYIHKKFVLKMVA